MKNTRFTVAIAESGVLQSEVRVVESGTAVLKCYTPFHEEVVWNRRTVLNSSSRYVALHGHLVASFRDTGRYALKHERQLRIMNIVNVTVADAGEYICIERNGVGPQSSVFLRVFGKRETD